MSTTLRTDVTNLFQDPFARQGYIDRIGRNLDAFNAASNGAITFRNTTKVGDYDYNAFVKSLGGTVARMDLTSTSAQTPLAFSTDQAIKVKLHRKAKATDVSRAASAISGFDMDAFALAWGEQVAEDQKADMLDRALGAARSALKEDAGSNYYDGTAGSLSTATLIAGLKKFGDQAGQIRLWVMHSKSYFDLLSYQTTPSNNGDLIANAAIVNASPASLGRPILVVDSDSLVVTTGTGTAAVTQYFVLGLQSGAISAEMTRGFDFLRMPVSGGEQIIDRFQGEYAYNLGLLGYKWDTQNGGLNPSDSAVATGTNWDAIFTNDRLRAGVAIEVD